MVGKITDWVVVAISFALVLGVGYWIWCDVVDGKIYNPVLEFGTRSTGVTHKTTKDVYYPGEMVMARVLFQKNRNLTGIIQWHLINKKITDFKSRQVTLPVGIWDTEVRVEILPEDTIPGEHWFCGVVTYLVNWLGKVEYPVWTNRFVVLPVVKTQKVRP